MNFLVSIITPSYNSIDFIISTYDSLVLQTYSNWEWLVTDDCSTDGTFTLLQALSEKDSRIKLFKNKINSGAAVTRNVSLKHATGEFIAFLDSDDLWYANKLEKQVAFMGKYINFSFTAYELIDSEDVKMGRTVDTKQIGSFNYQNQLRKKATMGCSTVMLRRSAFSDITMPLIRTRQDYALWLKLLKTGECAVILNEVLTQYRILPSSISRNKVKAAKKTWFVYRKIEKLSLFPACVSFIFYAWRGVFKTQ